MGCIQKIQVVDSKWKDIYFRSESVINTIFNLFVSGDSVSVSCSFGKDSLATLVLAIEALKRAVELGYKPSKLYVTHSDTLVENPALGFYCKTMIEKLRDYARSSSLPLEVVICAPDITSSFVYTTIGRGRLPVFPNKKNRICSMDWKVRPQQKALKSILKTIGKNIRHVSLVGTRHEESASRSNKMNERGDSPTVVSIDKSGMYYLAPIADWSVDEVWELLMSFDHSRGMPIYSTFRQNFEWTLNLYKDSNEGVCAIVVGDGGNKAPCSSRWGCFTCTAVANDASLDSMIDSETGLYKHLSGLSKFRQYLVDTQHDLSLRTIYGQTISDIGYINCRPDNYNIKMRNRLLRYLITLDVEEEERAEDHYERWLNGELERTVENELLCEPQFQFITPQMIMAIEFAWSVQSVNEEGFSACRAWYEIKHHNRRYYPPALTEEEKRKDKIPPKRWLFVGDPETLDAQMGLRNPLLEGLRGAEGFRTFQANGIDTRITPCELESSLSIDNEEAAIFLNLEFETIYFQFANTHSKDSLAYLLDRGLIKLPKSKLGTYHHMAKRYQMLRDRLTMFQSMSEAEATGNLISEAEHKLLLEAHYEDDNCTNHACYTTSTSDTEEDQLTLNL